MTTDVRAPSVPVYLAGEFVELGERLKTYAEAAPKQRASAQASLVAQAERVRRRFKPL